MANEVKIILDTAGVRELLRSTEMKAVCEKHARDIKDRCGKGYETDTYTGKNRVNAMVAASTIAAKKDNMKNNTLLKAVRG